jgi:hypothetical protein
VQHFDADLPAEKLGRHVPGAAGPRSRVAQIAGPRFRERDQFFDRAHRQRGIDDQHLRHETRKSDRREIPEDVVTRVGDDRRHHRERIGDREQRITVGRRFRDELRADELLAPGRFSMTICCPMLSDICCPSARATMSTLPPGASGTTRRMGFAG